MPATQHQRDEKLTSPPSYVVQAEEISHLVAQLTDRESGDEGGKQSSDSIASLSSNNYSGSTPAVAEKRNSFESTRPHRDCCAALGVCLH